MSDDIGDVSAQDLIRSLFNGPALAGVGATTDAGLTAAKHHVLPWPVHDRVEVEHFVDSDSGRPMWYEASDEDHTWGEYSAKVLFKHAKYNVEHVFGGTGFFAQYPAVDEQTRNDLLTDACAILFLSMSYNYYHEECREATSAEEAAIRDTPVEGWKEYLTIERLNRAATFIAARMHTKYQTNHVVGGTPMQASIAAAAKAFYGIGVARSTEAQQKSRAVAAVLHWALHPLNEKLLIPLVIKNSRISEASVHARGPNPVELVLDEYFDIRSSTPPSSTHHYYVCAAAVRLLEPMGVLNWLPQPTRLDDVKAGFAMIYTHGAALHPAARYWGLERVTSNQKLVEPLCADLGYAVKKLMPASSLAASPILQKEDALDSGWKAFIGALRAALDEKGGELIDQDTMKKLQAAIAPTHTDSGKIREVAGLLEMPASAKVKEAPPPEPSLPDPPAPAAAAPVAPKSGKGRAKGG